MSFHFQPKSQNKRELGKLLGAIMVLYYNYIQLLDVSEFYQFKYIQRFNVTVI